MYPALTVLSDLGQATSAWGGPPPITHLAEQALWVGSEDGMEAELVARAGVPYAGIPAGGLRGKSPTVAVRNVGKLSVGYTRARGLLKQFRPDVVFATGGYVGVPVVIAARQMGVKSALYLPDIQPGLAIQALARLVNVVCVSFEASRRYLPAQKVVETGYPTRPELFAARDKAAARSALGLATDTPTVLIFGGSRGAQRINEAVFGAAAAILERAQIIHVTGQGQAPAPVAAVAALPNGGRYHAYPYLHTEMVDALQAADLVVSRAGAATLGEYPAVGVPAILVPLSISGGHQWPNADFLAQAGGAVVTPNEELTAERLAQEVLAALDDPQRLAAQAAAMRRLARPDAAHRIAQELVRLAGGMA
ncbi:MAG: UDP-N-acetylglucosamine--N-acetylmuramyl-(pentapeptide) pyrophosphoryl-undecaprenol N-acetylglucosamine transferase [Anaerolineae bacterium]